MSLQKALEALEIGETHCLARRLNQDDCGSDDISEAATRLHNHGRAAIGRASKDGKAFTGEQVIARLTRGHHPLIIFAITREA